MNSEGSPALSDLARALLTASRTPALLLGPDGEVRMASSSFCRAFGLDPADIVGRALVMLEQWALPALGDLLTSVGGGTDQSGDCKIALSRPDLTPQILSINVQRIDDDATAGGALLMTVVDAAANGGASVDVEAQLRDKDMLMQELRHRTSNSLQIVASVLMHGARKTGSAEARGNLLDGYHRIMAVATVQQQLAITCRGEVDLRPYLTELCDSIRASLIGTPAHVTLNVEVADCRADAEVAGSLGLLVTELVINALKHAFPDDAEGTITVGYRCDGAAWALSIRDTGVGMSPDQPRQMLGLGSNIVRSIARKLDAEVLTTRRAPGTEIVISHA